MPGLMATLKTPFAFMLSAITLSAAMAVPASAAGSLAVKIEHARIRLLPGDLPLAGYFDLTNTGHEKLVLTGASSEAFGDVMMHRTEIGNGQARMVMLDRMTIAPGQTVHFAPEGYHLMLTGRVHPLSKGQSVPIRLEFDDGKSIEARFAVMGANLK